jgi:hypothetical protein
MTREEKIRILEEAQERAFKQIELTEGCEMGTEAFQRLIYCTEQLRWMAQYHEDVPVPEIVPNEPEEDEPKKDLPKIHVERIGNQMLAEVVEPEPETGDDEEPTFKMEEVRAALAKARGRGVNVSEIIRSFGADNFQRIPQNQYGAIMAKLAEA